MIEYYINGFIADQAKLKRIVDATFLTIIAEAGGGNE
jgi:hypothetical protein